MFDASGLIVTPGLIDAHVHCFTGCTTLGIPADEYCLGRGCTTAVDAGSAGCVCVRARAGGRARVCVSLCDLLAFCAAPRLSRRSEISSLSSSERASCQCATWHRPALRTGFSYTLRAMHLYGVDTHIFSQCKLCEHAHFCINVLHTYAAYTSILPEQVEPQERRRLGPTWGRPSGELDSLQYALHSAYCLYYRCFCHYHSV